MKVREIMTTDVATATPETTLEDIATMMRDEDTGAIPVLDNDALVGIITDRDIVIRCIAEGKDPVETTVEDVVTESLETIEPDSDIEKARELMSRRQIRRLPVVEDGEFIGMLSIGDLAVKSDADMGDTLEHVSEGVKASGGNAKRASQGNARAGSNKEAVPKIESGREANARAGRDQGRQSGRGEKQQAGRANGGRNPNQRTSSQSRSEEKKRPNKVVGKRNAGRATGTRRRAS